MHLVRMSQVEPEEQIVDERLRVKQGALHAMRDGQLDALLCACRSTTQKRHHDSRRIIDVHWCLLSSRLGSRHLSLFALALFLAAAELEQRSVGIRRRSLVRPHSRLSHFRDAYRSRKLACMPGLRRSRGRLALARPDAPQRIEQA